LKDASERFLAAARPDIPLPITITEGCTLFCFCISSEIVPSGRLSGNEFFFLSIEDFVGKKQRKIRNN
jgi:hypothetical protein